jgi:hypothetical protein
MTLLSDFIQGGSADVYAFKAERHKVYDLTDKCSGVALYTVRIATSLKIDAERAFGFNISNPIVFRVYTDEHPTGIMITLRGNETWSHKGTLSNIYIINSFEERSILITKTDLATPDITATEEFSLFDEVGSFRPLTETGEILSSYTKSYYLRPRVAGGAIWVAGWTYDNTGTKAYRVFNRQAAAPLPSTFQVKDLTSKEWTSLASLPQSNINEVHLMDLDSDTMIAYVFTSTSPTVHIVKYDKVGNSWTTLVSGTFLSRSVPDRSSSGPFGQYFVYDGHLYPMKTDPGFKVNLTTGARVAITTDANWTVGLWLNGVWWASRTWDVNSLGNTYTPYRVYDVDLNQWFTFDAPTTDVWYGSSTYNAGGLPFRWDDNTVAFIGRVAYTSNSAAPSNSDYQMDNKLWLLKTNSTAKYPTAGTYAGGDLTTYSGTSEITHYRIDQNRITVWFANENNIGIGTRLTLSGFPTTPLNVNTTMTVIEHGENFVVLYNGSANQTTHLTPKTQLTGTPTITHGWVNVASKILKNHYPIISRPHHSKNFMFAWQGTTSDWNGRFLTAQDVSRFSSSNEGNNTRFSHAFYDVKNTIPNIKRIGTATAPRGNWCGGLWRAVAYGGWNSTWTARPTWNLSLTPVDATGANYWQPMFGVTIAGLDGQVHERMQDFAPTICVYYDGIFYMRGTKRYFSVATNETVRYKETWATLNEDTLEENYIDYKRTDIGQTPNIGGFPLNIQFAYNGQMFWKIGASNDANLYYNQLRGGEEFFGRRFNDGAVGKYYQTITDFTDQQMLNASTFWNFVGFAKDSGVAGERPPIGNFATRLVPDLIFWDGIHLFKWQSSIGWGALTNERPIIYQSAVHGDRTAAVGTYRPLGVWTDNNIAICEHADGGQYYIFDLNDPYKPAKIIQASTPFNVRNGFNQNAGNAGTQGNETYNFQYSRIHMAGAEFVGGGVETSSAASYRDYSIYMVETGDVT